MVKELGLCSTCCKGKCPKVTISKDGVTIGEEGNAVKLKADEWNTLVEAVKKRKIGKAKKV